MEARWPQIRYMRQEFYSDRTQISDWLESLAGYLNPMGPFIKVQTSRSYPRPTESESQEMRFWNVCVLTTKKKKKSFKYMVIVNWDENHCPRQNWEVLTSNLVDFQYNASYLDVVILVCWRIRNGRRWRRGEVFKKKIKRKEKKMPDFKKRERERKGNEKKVTSKISLEEKIVKSSISFLQVLKPGRF